MPTTPEARRAYTRKISEERQAKMKQAAAERQEFMQWKKYFGLGKLNPADPQTVKRKDYIRWFLKLDYHELYYLWRAAHKLLKGIPVAPYIPNLKRRRPKNQTEDGGSIIKEL